jgi:hypothetical protein
MGKVASDIQENENAEKLYSRAVNIFYQEKCTPAFYKKLENFMITFVIDHALQRNEGIDEKDFIKDLSFYLVREKKYFLSNINYSIFKYFNDNKMYVACYNFMHLFPENSPFRENWKSSVEDENYKITQNKKKTIYKKIRAEIQEIIAEKEKYERISEKMKEHLKKYNDNNSLTLEQNSVNSENFFKPEERNKLLNFPKSHLSSFDFFAGEKSILFLNEEEEDYINEIRDLLKLK